MTILDNNDILVLNKNSGTVNRIINSIPSKEPLLNANVANERERGMLGIATSTSVDNEVGDGETKYVFLYYTESSGDDGNDICTPDYCEPGNDPLGNRLYRFELNSEEEKLSNPKLLLDLPATPGPVHNGGAIEIGPDNNLYVTIGDVLGETNTRSTTKAQNVKNGTNADGRGGILRVSQQGYIISGKKAMLGQEYPLNLYYAYGIRNSFGNLR